MKLHFEPNLDYQLQAVEAVCNLFHGQETCRTEFTVTRDPADQQIRLGFAENDLGIGNRLTLLDDELLKNLGDIQLKNGLSPSGSLDSGDFTVEMETGTGKTYVYLRTIFELEEEGITPLGGSHSESQAADPEEERRLFYVAVTRAMDELYISYCAHRMVYGKKVDTKPSRYISDIPDTFRESVTPNPGRSRQARGTKRDPLQLPLF